MQPSNIVNFAVATSVSMQYFQGNPTDGRIAHATSTVLCHIGKPPFMKSIYDLWVTVTSAMAVLERTLFPNQLVTTPTALALSQAWRPLSAVMDDSFQVHADAIPVAIRSLDTFNQWFRTHFDVYLHAETTAMIDDAALLLEAVHNFLMMRPNSDDPQPVVEDSTGGSNTAAPTDAAASSLYVPISDPWTTP